MPQLNSDGRIVFSSLFGEVQYRAIGDQAIQPAPVPRSVTGLGNSKAKFTNHHNRHRDLLSASHNRSDA